MGEFLTLLNLRERSFVFLRSNLAKRSGKVTLVLILETSRLFFHRCTCLKVHGMAATIPTALSLALAIRDAIPGGSPLDEASRSSISEDDDDDLGDSGEEGQEKEGSKRREERKRGIFTMQVLTDTTVVGDEITPLDDVRSLSDSCSNSG